MSRQTLDIELFLHGTITNPDTRDIPADAASDSVNIDPNSREGILMGVKGMGTPLSNVGNNIVESGFIEPQSGRYDLIYAKRHDGGIYLRENFYENNTELRILDGAHANPRVTLAKNNREIHAGMGMSPETPPKWLGYISHKGFIPHTTGSIVVEDAELKLPEGFPYFHKVLITDISGTLYAFGFEYGKGRVYKVNTSTNQVVSSANLGNIRGICDDSSTQLWVYATTDTSPNGIIYRINKSDLSVDTSSTLGSFTRATAGDETAQITDIAATTNRIWLGATFYGAASSVRSSEENYVFTVDKTAIGTQNIAVTNRTPQLISTNTTAGSWVRLIMQDDWVAEELQPESNAVRPSARSLIPISATQIAWLVEGQEVQFFDQIVDFQNGEYIGRNETWPVYHSTDGAPNKYKQLRHFAMVVGESSVKSAKTSIMNQRTAKYNAGAVYDSGTMYATVANTLYRMTQSIPGTTGQVLSYSNVGNFDVGQFGDPIQVYSGFVYINRLKDNTGVDRYQISNDAITALLSSNALTVSVADATSTEEPFPVDKYFFYRVSLTYDGYQQSPLSYLLHNPVQGVKPKIISVSFAKNAIGSRVTHLNVYRAEGKTDLEPETFYRLVESIPHDDPRFAQTDTHISIDVYDSYNQGASYEAHTGIPETIDSCIVNYELSAVVNNELCVARCWHPDIEDASHYIFKSKPFRYNTFDWTQDYLRLPFIPIALVTFAGRLFAFDSNSIYRINPSGLFIEDVFPGYGVDSRYDVCVTMRGIFFRNNYNAYHFSGDAVTPIGDPIRNELTKYTHPLGVTDFIPRQTVYDEEMQCVLFLEARSASPAGMWIWMYHIERERWDKAVLSTESNLDVHRCFGGPKNDVYISGKTSFVKLFHGARLSWEWISKKFSFNDSSQVKKVYKLLVSSTGTIVKYYRIDSETEWTLLSGTDLSAAKRASKLFQFRLVGSGGTAQVTSVSIIHRPMIGKR
jgi:hypothetical protein